MSTEKFLFEIAANTKKLRDELKDSRSESTKLGDDLVKTEKKSKSFGDGLSSAGNGAKKLATAVAAATAAVLAFTVVQGRNIRENEDMATAAGLTSEEFKRMSFVMGTAGISGEKFGDIMKDTQEKIGDFLNTGGGGFQDFADTMGYTKKQASEVANEFKSLSGQEVLQAMVNRMQDAGVSSQQMSHALEGMASDTTRLIPLLRDGGAAAKELGDKYDAVNIELTDEEKKQFKDLADNVDLATTSFVNMLQNAITPLVPKMNELLTTFTGFFRESATKAKLFRIYGDQEAIKDLDNIEEVEELTNRVIQDRIELGQKLERGGISDKGFADKLQELAITQENLAVQKEILSIKKLLSDIDEKNKPKEEENKPTKSGADNIKLEEKLLEDLRLHQEAQKSELRLLLDEKTERLKILEGMYNEENKLSADKKREKKEIEKQIEADYLDQAREVAKTEEQAKLEAIVNEQKALEEILNHKLISQEEYQAKLNEIIGEYAPETLDPDLLEERNQYELAQLNDKLGNQLISYQEYFEKLGTLQQKDSEDKKAKDKLENFWSKSSVKTQLDQGTALLTSLGNNSKTAHKIKQGLAAANAGMNTAEGVTKALADQNYVGATLTAATGVAQIAAILASKPDGSGSVVTPTAQAPTQQPIESYSEQSSTLTDLSSGGNSSQRLVLEFNDDVVDVIARKIDESKRNGRT